RTSRPPGFRSLTESWMPKVEAFRSRSLEEEYAVIWIDALYQKVRVEGRVVSVAVMIACGVKQSGNHEILAVEPMFDESEDSWRLFFQNLKKRGMKRTALVVSDAHAGIQAAVRKEWLGASWQSCEDTSCETSEPRCPIGRKCASRLI
ncbi:MAG: hypothetical protein GYA74_08620, partial [Acidobacteria bacterium]|nr:hypothetical protein [Acidobacteriota bacterium]